ncbi:MAG: penicillin-binding protein 2 [Burkholderiaceae bacterium]
MSRSRRAARIPVPKPVLELRLSPGRLRVLLVLVGLGFVVLTARATYLQTLRHEELQERGEKVYTREQSLPASRGKILDRNGVVLASSLPAVAVVVDPLLFYDPPAPEPGEQPSERKGASKAQRRALAKALDMETAQLDQVIERGSRRFAYLRRQFDPARGEAIARMDIPGVGIRPEYKRHYPEGEVAAHVVGFTDYDDRGVEGVELASDLRLRGVKGKRQVMRDRRGQVIDDIRIVSNPIDGDDEQLSIDSRLQYMAYAALRDSIVEHQALAGSVVVLDVLTGEVLAMATVPTYDPNDRSELKRTHMRMRAITDRFEPGSTMKPFSIALALELRKVTPNTIIETAPGFLKIGPDRIGDSHFLGTLTVSQVVQKSSNVGTAKIALDMPARQIWEFLTALGFGQSPRVDFPGAVAGSLRPWRKWRPVEQATISYGHGLSVTLLQLARAYLVFARDGDLPEVTLRRRAGPVAGRPILSTKTTLAIRDMIEAAASLEGTGGKAMVTGYRVAGKTGTSLKQEHGRYVKKYVDSFVGFAPVSAPRLLVAVMIDEPTDGKYYAGDVAAPVFSRVMGDALNLRRIAPDAPVAEIEVPGPTAEVRR